MVKGIYFLRSGERAVLDRFPRIQKQKERLPADAVTLSALTALEETLSRPEIELAGLNDLGFNFEKVNGHTVLALSGEQIIVNGSDLMVDEIDSARVLFDFQKRWQACLQKTVEDLWELWNSAPVGYHTLDRDGIITAVNETEAKLLGYRPEEMRGRSIFDFIHPQQRSMAHRRFADKLAGKSVPPVQDRIYIHKNGSEVNMSAEDLLHTDARGCVIGVKTVLVDISKLRRLQECIYQLQKKEDIGDLAIGVAHEFNNIIGAILPAAGMVKRQKLKDPGDVQAAMEIILDSCQRAKRITEALLYYAQLKSYVPSEISPKYIAKKIVELMEEQTYPAILYEVAAIGRFKVLGGEQQVFQAVLNLCMNARDAILNDTGQIEIGIIDRPFEAEYLTTSGLKLKPGNYVAITVKDNGSGIAPEDLPKIFDPFFTTKPPAKATGLGLSTVLGIMDAHHGGIDVKSEVDRGTEMTLYFPGIED